MHWRRTTVVWALGVVAAASLPRAAAGQDSGVSRAGVLLTLAADARSLGLADAAGAATADAWSIFYAPAQLAGVRRIGAGIATEGYLAGTQLSAAAVALPLGRGVLGIAATLLDYGTIAEIAASVAGTDGVETGREYSARDHAVLVAYAIGGPRFRLGAAGEFIGSSVADLSANAAALSAGVAWTTAAAWNVAASVQHLGAEMSLGATRGALPATARLSVAAPSRSLGHVAIRPMVEGRTVRGGGGAAVLAAEATWRGNRGAGLAVRAGVTARSGVNDDRWPLSIGAGATLGSFAIDYAVQRFPTIDQVTHRIGLRIVPRDGGRHAMRATPSRARSRAR